MMERIEKMRVSDDALDLVFRKARTYNAWLPKPVPEELLRQLYDTLKWGPTSANISPARFVFIRSTAAKERLRPSLAPGNLQKTMAAPVTVIIAYDLKFYDKLPRLLPHYPAMRDMFVNNPQLIQETALRNSTLQGAYMILAARALGLDCGPMSGIARVHTGPNRSHRTSNFTSTLPSFVDLLPSKSFFKPSAFGNRWLGSKTTHHKLSQSGCRR